MKLSFMVRYIQNTKECRNILLGILIFHEIMFHVSMSYKVCHFLLTATELQVTYQLDGASPFFVLPRSRCPPCPTASSLRPQSSWQWTPTSSPSWPTRPAGLVAVIPEGQPRRLLGLLLLVVLADQGHRAAVRARAVALPVLLIQVYTLQTLLLLLRLLLPLLLVVTLKPLMTLAGAPQPQSSATPSVLALALLDRSSTISC